MIRRDLVEKKFSEHLGLSTHYFSNDDECFLSNVSKEMFWDDLVQGDGNELHGDPPKIRSVGSSSALVVNSFAPWKTDLMNLNIDGYQGFENLFFEKKFDNGLRGNSPNLDVALYRDDILIAIESKFLEPLSYKKPTFSNSYHQITDHRKNTKWFKAMEEICNNKISFKYLDAAQLIKHFFGLCYKQEKETVKLIYVYWEPINAIELPQFVEHRAEIEMFSNVVSGDSLLSFNSISYNELWNQWNKDLIDPKMKQHISELKDRYLIRTSIR
jgi:hypothetical protein